jgi:predicted Ser/Thr protein kinase
MGLAPGSTLRHIRVERLLGAGGMSEVWRGFDDKLQRPVALKVVHSRRRLDPVARARFLREARILSSLEHPGICKVYGLEEEGGEDVLVLELVEGQSLAEAMAEGLDRDLQLALAESVAEVLAAAHAHGIVHRDLKPQNVMCTPSGGVKVLDFDLAHREGEEVVAAAREASPAGEADAEATGATPTGALVGTVAYMSPEQARGDDLTTSSDLYSLGILLHELFSGRRAYAAAPTLEARLLKVCAADTEPVTGLEPELGRLLAALEDSDPGRRPSASEVVRRLRGIRVRRGRRRRRQLLFAAAAVGAVALATWALLAGGPGRGRPRLTEARQLRLEPIENRTGDSALDWVDAGLTAMVAEALANSGVGLAAPSGPVRDADLRVAARLEREGASFLLVADLETATGPAGRLEGRGGTPLEAADRLLGVLADRLPGGIRRPSLPASLSADANADLLYGLGLDARQRGHLDEARRCFELCLDRDPRFHWARLELARSAALEGKSEEAARLAREVVSAARELGREDLADAAGAVLADLPGVDGVAE